MCVCVGGREEGREGMGFCDKAGWKHRAEG